MKMKRLLFLTALLCCAASPSLAGPKRVLRAVGKHVTLDFAAGVSSVLVSRSAYDCRARNGPPPCAMHYGSLREFAISDAALTGTAILLSEWGRKQGFREWFLPAAAVTAGNSIFAVKQWRTHARRITD
jgi:hypothetical protein